MYLEAGTLDDLLRQVLQAIDEQGKAVDPTKGSNRELTSVLLKLSNPRARLSRTDRKGKIFSAIGELAWYLAKSNDGGFISYYIPCYPDYAESDGTVHGAYGPRLFEWRDGNQFLNVAELLKKNRVTRKAVIQLYDAADIINSYKDVPCTCTLQFLIRDGLLELITSMRSNDAYRGLPHDIFSFTMLQEIMARTVGCDVGVYSHFAGSLHLYDRDLLNAKKYLKEGWQSTVDVAMPPMPHGDPWSCIEQWLTAEAAIRSDECGDGNLIGLDPYWQDLAKLLQAFRYFKSKDRSGVTRIKGEIINSIYHEYVAAREDLFFEENAASDAIV